MFFVAAARATTPKVTSAPVWSGIVHEGLDYPHWLFMRFHVTYTHVHVCLLLRLAAAPPAVSAPVSGIDNASLC